jgi:excisionase family DNA binding protein
MKNDPNSAAETLILPEAAKFLRISRSHLLNILKGKVAGVPLLPYSRLGRRLLFRRSALEQWLREAEAGTLGAEAPLVGNDVRC